MPYWIDRFYCVKKTVAFRLIFVALVHKIEKILQFSMTIHHTFFKEKQTLRANIIFFLCFADLSTWKLTFMVRMCVCVRECMHASLEGNQ